MGRLLPGSGQRRREPRRARSLLQWHSRQLDGRRRHPQDRGRPGRPHRGPDPVEVGEQRLGEGDLLRWRHPLGVERRGRHVGGEHHGDRHHGQARFPEQGRRHAHGSHRTGGLRPRRHGHRPARSRHLRLLPRSQRRGEHRRRKGFRRPARLPLCGQHGLRAGGRRPRRGERQPVLRHLLVGRLPGGGRRTGRRRQRRGPGWRWRNL